MYCVKCKAKTDTKSRTNFVNKSGHPMLKEECAVCRITKTQFVKGEKQGGDLVGSLNSIRLLVVSSYLLKLISA